MELIHTKYVLIHTKYVLNRIWCIHEINADYDKKEDTEIKYDLSFDFLRIFTIEEILI